MNNWWVHDMWQNGMVIDLVSWIFWVLLSITLHELGHGWAALRQGDDTPVRLGRMTLNPVTHMGTTSLVVFALCGIAWGQMPVNPVRFRDGRRGDVIVSAAGPAVNVLLALASLVLLMAWMRLGPKGTDTYRLVTVFLYYGVALNLILAPFNLLPIPPLDGSRILAGLSNRAREMYQHPHAQIIGLGIFVVVFFVSPMGDVLFRWAWQGTDTLIDAAGGRLGNPPVKYVMYEDEIRRMLQDEDTLRRLLEEAGALEETAPPEAPPTGP